MKKYPKSKFWFLNNDGTKKQPQNGDNYYKQEYKIQLKFPFIIRLLITYQLIDNVWVQIETIIKQH